MQNMDVYYSALTTYSTIYITMHDNNFDSKFKKVKTYIWEGKN